MRKSIMLLLVMLISSSSYASFPVKKECSKVDVVTATSDVNQENLSSPKFLSEFQSGDFSIGGFLIGFLFGLVGVACVYIFSKDDLARRSSWYGLGAWLVIFLLLL